MQSHGAGIARSWHDSVDGANLREFDYGDIPDERFVMTTWHEKEALEKALWFGGQCAFHPTIALTNTIIVDIAAEPREAVMVQVGSNLPSVAFGSD